jgi:3-dehydroquinate synthase
VTTSIPVEVAGGSYPVTIGSGLLAGLPDGLQLPDGVRRAAVVSAAPIAEHYGDAVIVGLESAGLEACLCQVPDGEQAKSLATLETLYRRFAAIPLHRSDAVVALGGGVVGDLAGFAAATWNRGVPLVQLPTTVLAQVDAAIGGKTGINLPEGKNLVGGFHQPVAVLADTATLATLPERERRAGLAEAVKCGFIADEALLSLLEYRPDDAVAGEPELLADVVARCAVIKARVVGADEREAGSREWLNYGHTLAHAIEALTDYSAYRHGEAVALGLVFAARLGERLGVARAGLGQRTVAVLDGLGLPTGGISPDPASVREVIARDKKARGTVRFVLCKLPGQMTLVDDPGPELFDEVLATLA